jgi:predicted SAM-dependent methyltransferase
MADMGSTATRRPRPRVADLLLSPTAAASFVRRRLQAPYRRLIRRRNARRLAGLAPASSVHLGCGDNRWDGWVDVDIRASIHPDVLLDLRGGFPAPAGSCRYVYSEHVFEHLLLGDALQVFRDVAAALAPGGVMRIAMPDLDELVARYGADDWRDQAWLEAPEYAHVDSPARMLNMAVREWGHKYVYSFGELDLRLRACGFSQIVRCSMGESDHEALRSRETRPDSVLVVEASVTPPGSA